MSTTRTMALKMSATWTMALKVSATVRMALKISATGTMALKVSDTGTFMTTTNCHIYANHVCMQNQSYIYDMAHIYMILCIYIAAYIARVIYMHTDMFSKIIYMGSYIARFGAYI